MIEDFPKDGTTFVTETVERATYRWTRYKPDGARQMGKPGRFQKMVWKGDFFKWENAEPEGYLIQGDKGPLQERDEAILAKDAEIAKLRDALTVLEKAATEFHDAATEYLSDSTYDADGVLANAEAQLSVTAIPGARAALNGGSDAP